MGRLGHHLRANPFEDVFDAPIAVEDEPANEAEQKQELAAKPHPLRRANGEAIGIGAYSKLVTPAWQWDIPHLRFIAHVLDDVTDGKKRFVILNVPPRHGKTELTTVRQAGYRLELDPSLPIILAAHSDKFAQKLSRKIRRIVTGRVELSREKNAADDWETTEGGGVRALGVGTGTAGLPAKLILVDDPFKSRKQAFSEAYREQVWEWFREDLFTRLEPNGAIVITMTRRHEDDLVGRLLASEDAADWEVIRLPANAESDDPLGRKEGEALWPERFNEAALKKIKRTVGNLSYSSLYQQRPAPAEGHIFKKAWFRYYTTKEHPIAGVPQLPDVFNSHLQSWDMSFKDAEDSNPVAGHRYSRLGANCYLRARRHGRWDFTRSLAEVIAMTREDPKAHLKLIEDKANGPAIISVAKRKISGIVPVQPDGDKIARAHAITPMFEAGQVWFPHPAIAPWIEEVTAELLHFPYGATDDDVDALTQGLRRLQLQIEDGSSETSGDQTTDEVYSEAARVANQERW